MTGSDAGSAVPNRKEGGGAFLGRAGSAVAAQPARPPAIAVEYRCCHALQVPNVPANPALRYPRRLRLSGCLPSRGLRREASGASQPSCLQQQQEDEEASGVASPAGFASPLAFASPPLRPNPCQKLLPIRLRFQAGTRLGQIAGRLPAEGERTLFLDSDQPKASCTACFQLAGDFCRPSGCASVPAAGAKGKATSAASRRTGSPRQDRLAGRSAENLGGFPARRPPKAQAEELALP